MQILENILLLQNPNPFPSQTPPNLSPLSPSLYLPSGPFNRFPLPLRPSKPRLVSSPSHALQPPCLWPLQFHFYFNWSPSLCHWWLSLRHPVVSHRSPIFFLLHISLQFPHFIVGSSLPHAFASRELCLCGSAGFRSNSCCRWWVPTHHVWGCWE